MSDRFDVVVVGGGTAGLVTASGCARLGRRVALVEKEALGGDCLWTGCVPTKALIATAKIVAQAAHADRFGLLPHVFEISPRAVMESMRVAQAVIQKHDDPARFRALGVEVIKGTARFTAPNEIEVDGSRFNATDMVIATGSRTAVPPVDGLVESGFLDHASFLAQDRFPKSIAVLGGGYIGIEFAQLFRRFGSEVTVVEMADGIIGREDRDVIAFVRGLLQEEGIDVRSGWTAKRAWRESAGKVIEIESRGGERQELRAEEIFVASGRRGNTDNLGLEAIGVRMNRSYVAVDEYLRTSLPHVWACGDVQGEMQFTHAAAYEAVKLVRNMLFPGKSKVDYTHVPAALYTDPEVARIGLTEDEAVSHHGRAEIRTYVAEMDDVDRSVVDRATRGFVKIVADRKGRIVGAHVVSTHASTLVQIFVLARKQGLKVGELAQLVSSYPSLADAVQKAASKYYENIGAGRLGALAKKVAGWTQ